MTGVLDRALTLMANNFVFIFAASLVSVATQDNIELVYTRNYDFNPTVCGNSSVTPLHLATLKLSGGSVNWFALQPVLW